MKTILANFCILSGSLGFLDYLLVIDGAKVGCCTGMSVSSFNKLLLGILLLGLGYFLYCMYNNCIRKKKSCISRQGG